MSLWLDIGCGSVDQKKEGYIGIDVNPAYRPDVLHDCAKGIPYKDRSVEGIWMDNVLEHFQDPHFVLRECKRVLRKYGVLHIKLPNLQYFPILCAMFFGDVQKMWNRWMNSKYKQGRSQHYTLWTPEVLRLQLEHYGFDIVYEDSSLYGKEFYIKAVKK